MTFPTHLSLGPTAATAWSMETHREFRPVSSTMAWVGAVLLCFRMIERPYTLHPRTFRAIPQGTIRPTVCRATKKETEGSEGSGLTPPVTPTALSVLVITTHTLGVNTQGTWRPSLDTLSRTQREDFPGWLPYLIHSNNPHRPVSFSPRGQPCSSKSKAELISVGPMVC
jgi:hypothetical protein